MGRLLRICFWHSLRPKLLNIVIATVIIPPLPSLPPSTIITTIAATMITTTGYKNDNITVTVQTWSERTARPGGAARRRGEKKLNAEKWSRPSSRPTLVSEPDPRIIESLVLRLDPGTDCFRYHYTTFDPTK